MSLAVKQYLDSNKVTTDSVSKRSQRIANKLVEAGVVINDANSNLFTAAQLDQVEAAFISYKRLTAEAPVILPLISVESGRLTYSYTVYNASNGAMQAADGVEITPSDLEGHPANASIVNYRDSFKLSDDEVRQASVAGVPLETFGAQSVSANLQDRMDQMAMIGDGTIRGLLNATGTTTYSIPADGTGASALWSTKTGEQILRDLCGAVDAISTGTDGKHKADTLVIGEDRRLLVQGMKRTAGGGTDQTVLQAFNQARPGVKVVGTYFMANTPVAVTSTGGKLSQRIIAFESQPFNLGRLVAMGPTIVGMDVAELITKFQSKCRIGGTVVRRPLAVCVATPVSGGI